MNTASHWTARRIAAAARPTTVDGFAYTTTAPARPATRLPVGHYVDLAASAALGTDTETGVVR